MTEVWTEDKERELLETLKALPDFESWPIPQHWYKKYNLPPRNPQTFKDFAQSGYWVQRHFDPKVEREIRTEPVPGGVRPILEVEPVKAETIVKSADESQQVTENKKEDSTESNDLMPPLSSDHSSPLPSQNDGPSTTLSA